jgi:hypothetical protein
MQMDVLVESIFPMTANALDTLIGGVEVERLAGVQLTTLPTGPPADDPRNEGLLTDPWVRLCASGQIRA